MTDDNTAAGTAPAAAVVPGENDEDQKASAAAAEQEGSGDPITLEHDGLTLTLPPELPFNLMRDIAKARNDAELFSMVMETLLGPEQMAEVWAAKLGMTSGIALVDKIMENYGTSLGKLSAS